MKRELFYQDDKSNKFWTVEVAGKEVVTTNGRIGASPRETRKTFPDAATAKREADKLLASKLRGGYQEARAPKTGSGTRRKGIGRGAAPVRVPGAEWSTKKMSEDVFWEIIALFDWRKTGDDDAVLARARAALAQMAVVDIQRFDDILADKLFALDTEGHARNIGEDAYVDDRQHFSVDEFLYSRCCVVANGKRFFERVLARPKAMPKDMEFESILYLAGAAFTAKTKKDYRHTSRTSYETFSNKAGWGAPGAAKSKPKPKLKPKSKPKSKLRPKARRK